MINKGLSKAAAFFLYLLSLLPLPLLYLFADLIFVLLYHVIKYRRKVVFENIQNSFPHKTHQEHRVIEKEFFNYFADLTVETIKMFSASPEFLAKRYSFTNIELVQNLEAKNQSYLIAVGHYGNWEWNTIVISKVLKAQIIILYKPLNNPVFDEFFKKAREKSGTILVRMKIALREIAKRRKELTATVFASDQTPSPDDGHIWINFLNQQTSVFYGLEKVAKATNYPVVFCDMQRVKRGYYACDFKLVSDHPTETAENEITLKHTALLEDRINAEPSYWLWSHRRWKHKRAYENERA